MLADNPRLNVRAFPTLRQPARIVLDSKLQTPLGSHIISDDLSPTVIVTAVDDKERLKPYRAFNHIRILRSSEKAYASCCSFAPVRHHSYSDKGSSGEA